MVPTLKDGNIMILNKIGYRINGLKRFDIVVIDYDKERLIKRVVGLPNEKIEYKNNILYVDGKEVKETFINVDTEDFKFDKIPKDSYFLMGDNRGNSVDSRLFGPINKDNIIGKTKLIIFPIERIDIVK